MRSYPSQIFYTAILVLFIGIKSTQSEQGVDVTAKKPFDESQFIFYSVSIASSPHLIRYVAENEEIIYTLIKDFYVRHGPRDTHLRQPSQEPFQLMHSYLLNFELKTDLSSLKLKRQKENISYRPYKTVWNPLSTYFMFQRFMKPLKQIMRSLNTTNEPEFALQKQIFNVMRSTGWPRQEDLNTATSAIIRIQHVYDLNTYELSNGIIAGYETNVTLSGVDCVELGKQAMVDSYHALAVEWFEVGQYKHIYVPGVPAAEISGSTDDDTIEYYIKRSQETHDHHWNISETWDPVFFTRPFNNDPSRIRRRTTELQTWKGGLTPNFNNINYWGTCSGENYKTEKEKSKLFCWYETEINYSYKINPLKAELLSSEPLVVIQYYDMIGDKMIEKIKLDTNNRLAHSTVYGESNNQVVSPIRTSLNTWIDDNTRKDFFSIPHKIEAATGLKVKKPTSSEMLQVAAYTAGSHYLVHLDAFLGKPNDSQKDQANGDRIATFIYYLTDVEKGGGTSFPQSGIASEPIKGSAVVWFNLLRNGNIDDNTWHGACPIIIGEKWICNKWIRSNDQMFLTDYQCVPDQNARFRLRINGKDLSELL